MDRAERPRSAACRPSRRVCWSGSPRTPCSARACRPHGGPSPAVTSVEPLSAQTVMQYIGPDIFHPQPGVLVLPRCRSVVRHRPVLPDRPGSAVRIGGQCRGGRFDQTGPPGRSRPVTGPAPPSTCRSPPTCRRSRGSSTAVSARAVFSFDSPLTRMGYVEVTGTEGTMIIPDPNMFTGDVKITRAPAFAAIGDDPQWESVPDHRRVRRTRPGCARSGSGVADRRQTAGLRGAGLPRPRHPGRHRRSHHREPGGPGPQPRRPGPIGGRGPTTPSPPPSSRCDTGAVADGAGRAIERQTAPDRDCMRTRWASASAITRRRLASSSESTCSAYRQATASKISRTTPATTSARATRSVPAETRHDRASMTSPGRGQ